jgi:hypothetical protein
MVDSKRSADHDPREKAPVERKPSHPSREAIEIFAQRLPRRLRAVNARVPVRPRFADHRGARFEGGDVPIAVDAGP